MSEPISNPNPNPITALISMAGRTPAESKKARMAFAAMACVAMIFTFAVAVMCLEEKLAEPIAGLAKVAAGTIATIARVYCGAQAHADASTADALGKAGEK